MASSSSPADPPAASSSSGSLEPSFVVTMMEDDIASNENIEKASEAVEDEDAASGDWVLTDSQYAQVRIEIPNVRS